MTSDGLRANQGDGALRYAIIGVMVTSYGWAAVHFFWAGKYLRVDFLRAAATPRPG